MVPTIKPDSCEWRRARLVNSMDIVQQTPFRSSSFSKYPSLHFRLKSQSGDERRTPEVLLPDDQQYISVLHMLDGEHVIVAMMVCHHFCDICVVIRCVMFLFSSPFIRFRVERQKTSRVNCVCGRPDFCQWAMQRIELR